MSLRERLLAQQLPKREVVLAPAEPGGEPDRVTVRALAPEDWDALVRLHPPSTEEAAQGWTWDVRTFRPALLAACVLSPADATHPLTEEDWVVLLLKLPVGDRERLYGAALDVNDNRWPGADVGKG